MPDADAVAAGGRAGPHGRTAASPVAVLATAGAAAALLSDSGATIPPPVGASPAVVATGAVPDKAAPMRADGAIASGSAPSGPTAESQADMNGFSAPAGSHAGAATYEHGLVSVRPQAADGTVAVRIENGTLGTIEVHVGSDADRGARLTVLTDRPDTLGTLMRDDHELRAALESAGVGNDTVIRYGLRDGDGGGAGASGGGSDLDRDPAGRGTNNGGDRPDQRPAGASASPTASAPVAPAREARPVAPRAARHATIDITA